MKKKNKTLRRIRLCAARYFKWFSGYVRRVRMVERELGGELAAC